MNQNCTERISDVVRWYIVPTEKKNYGIPCSVKMKSITPALMGVTNWDNFLASLPHFSISPTEQGDDSLYIYMEENPQVKISSKTGLSGMIYSIAATFTIVDPAMTTEIALKNLVESNDFDSIVEYSDGSFRLFRSLAHTAGLVLEESTKTERVLSLKLSAQSVTSLIPVVR